MFQKFSFGPPVFVFDKPVKIFPTNFDKNPFVVQKKWKSVCFEKYFFL